MKFVDLSPVAWSVHNIHCLHSADQVVELLMIADRSQTGNLAISQENIVLNYYLAVHQL